MGCNCKETAKRAGKYTDEETIVNLTGIRKIGFFMRKIMTIVLVIIVFIVATPFGILFGIKNIITGKANTINLSKIIKLFNVRN